MAVRAGLAVALIVGVGRYLLRPLLRLVARTGSSDLFMAATLLIAVGAAGAANLAGISMTLGAFIAGLPTLPVVNVGAIELVADRQPASELSAPGAAPDLDPCMAHHCHSTHWAARSL